MHFFIFFAVVHCVFAFITPGLCFAQPVGIAKPLFLQHMFNEQPSQNSVSEKKNTNTEKKPAPASQDSVKSKKRLSSSITKLPLFLCKGICQCGGKKLWNMILPKHVRKATIVGSLKLLDALSFIAGSFIVYAGYFTFVNKQETLLQWYTSLSLSFNTLFRSSTKIVHNKPFSEDDNEPSDRSDSKENNDIISKDNTSNHIISKTHPSLPPIFF